MRIAVRLRAWRPALAVSVALGGGASAADGPSDEDDDKTFGMSDPVVCKEIRGYEDFEPRPGSALTADEKLLIYFRPRYYKTVRKGEKHEAHLIQDGRIRRKGEKAVLWSRTKMVDYKPQADAPPRLIFIKNTVSLKGLKPGDYEFEVTLHDEVGQSAPAVRTLPFKIIPSPAVATDGGEKEEGPGRPAGRPGPP